MADGVLTCTLSIDYCDSTIVITQQDRVLWTAKLDFAEIELELTITMYLRYKRDLLIGKPTAERILFDIGSMLPLTQERVTTASGRDLRTGLPHRLEVTSFEIREQIRPYCVGFVDTMQWILNKPILSDNPRQVPKELRAEISSLPILIRGKYAQLRGLTDYLRDELEREIIVVPD